MLTGAVGGAAAIHQHAHLPGVLPREASLADDLAEALGAVGASHEDEVASSKLAPTGVVTALLPRGRDGGVDLVGVGEARSAGCRGG
eukprot:3937278-Rhodomonas_salina.1